MDTSRASRVLMQSMQPNSASDNGKREAPVQKNQHHNPLLRIGMVVIGIAMLIVGSSLVLHSTRPPANKVVLPPKKIEFIPAKTGNVSQTIRSFGKLTLTHYADVGTQIPGQVKEVYVTLGEAVRAGKLVVEIAPAPDTERMESNRAQLARLNAELADQSAQLDFSRLQYQRQSRLIADHATREEDVESSKMNMLSGAAKVEAINAQIQQVQATIRQDEEIRRQTKVTAPINGTVVALSVHNGQMISSNQSNLLRIADLGTITVQARVAENDVTQLHKGMMATFATPGLPGRHWSGKLMQIMPLPIDDNAQQDKPTFYTVLFDVANPDHALMSGMNAEIEFLQSQVDNVVTVPTCVLENPKKSGTQSVSVIDAGGKLSERKISLGLMSAQLAEVTSGLQAGDKVVALNQAVMPDCVRLANGNANK